jgi:(S)-2-hydroxy-acid oxidase
MCLSTLSTTSLQDVAAASSQGLRWFQLYIYKDRSVTLELIRAAEAHGFKAIVLTVDTPFFGTREADVRNAFALPNHLSLANFKRAAEASNIITEKKQGSGLANCQSQQTHNTD